MTRANLSTPIYMKFQFFSDYAKKCVYDYDLNSISLIVVLFT